MVSALLGKLALITGGSGTIGQAIANRLALAGASVVLTGRNLTKLDEAAEKIKSNLASNFTTIGDDVCELPKVETISCDVTKEDSVEALFARIKEQNGKAVDLLINNAGTAAAKPTTELSGSEFDWVMKVNVLGPFLCAREAMKSMTGGGRIINIGSLSALSPRPDSAPYTTSKFALNGLSRSLALDGRDKGISVGIIHPGNVKSELLDEATIQKRGYEGFMDPEDVAESVFLMASMPPTTNVLELTVMPTPQPLVGRG